MARASEIDPDSQPKRGFNVSVRIPRGIQVELNVGSELNVLSQLHPPERFHAVVVAPGAVGRILPHEANAEPVVVVAHELREDESG